MHDMNELYHFPKDDLKKDCFPHNKIRTLRNHLYEQYGGGSGRYKNTRLLLICRVVGFLCISMFFFPLDQIN